MSEPPMRAIEKIAKYCEHHICEECPFGYLVANENYSGYLVNGCLLNELAPYQWGQIRISEKVTE